MTDAIAGEQWRVKREAEGRMRRHDACPPEWRELDRRTWRSFAANHYLKGTSLKSARIKLAWLEKQAGVEAQE